MGEHTGPAIETLSRNDQSSSEFGERLVAVPSNRDDIAMPNTPDVRHVDAGFHGNHHALLEHSVIIVAEIGLLSPTQK